MNEEPYSNQGLWIEIKMKKIEREKERKKNQSN